MSYYSITIVVAHIGSTEKISSIRHNNLWEENGTKLISNASKPNRLCITRKCKGISYTNNRLMKLEDGTLEIADILGVLFVSEAEVENLKHLAIR